MFVFNCFPILAVKLECFVTYENNFIYYEMSKSNSKIIKNINLVGLNPGEMANRGKIDWKSTLKMSNVHNQKKLKIEHRFYY